MLALGQCRTRTKVIVLYARPGSTHDQLLARCRAESCGQGTILFFETEATTSTKNIKETKKETHNTDTHTGYSAPRMHHPGLSMSQTGPPSTRTVACLIAEQCASNEQMQRNLPRHSYPRIKREGRKGGKKKGKSGKHTHTVYRRTYVWLVRQRRERP